MLKDPFIEYVCFAKYSNNSIRNAENVISAKSTMTLNDSMNKWETFIRMDKLIAVFLKSVFTNSP